jgi:hypothetical protein
MRRDWRGRIDPRRPVDRAEHRHLCIRWMVGGAFSADRSGAWRHIG